MSAAEIHQREREEGGLQPPGGNGGHHCQPMVGGEVGDCWQLHHLRRRAFRSSRQGDSQSWYGWAQRQLCSSGAHILSVLSFLSDNVISGDPNIELASPDDERSGNKHCYGGEVRELAGRKYLTDLPTSYSG